MEMRNGELLAAGMVAAIAVPTMAEAPGPDVTICHIPNGMDVHVQVFGGKTYNFRFGKLETVGERAVAAHRAHGDFVDYYYPFIDKAYFESRGVTFEDWADCYFYTLS